jgi:hypothetical protein
MKTSRKKMLLSSIAMLLVALVALGSATYAWFSISKTVTANNMQIKAVATAGLEISKTSATSGYDPVSVSFGQDDDTNYDLKPVSWVPAITKSSDAFASFTNKGYIPNANIASPGVAPYTGTTWTDTTDKPATTLGKSTKGYFATYPIWIRSAAEDGTRVAHTVSASVKIEGNDAGFARAYLVDAETADNSKVFADTSTSFAASTGTGAATTANVTGVKASEETTSVTGTDTTENGKLFYLVVWFDGQDSNCVDSAKGGFGKFTVSFTATDM